MSEIKLIDDWVVVVDDLNYALAKKSPLKKKEGSDDKREWSYKYYGYYGSLTNAIHALCDRLVRDDLKKLESASLKEAVDTIVASEERVADLLKGVLDGR